MKKIFAFTLFFFWGTLSPVNAQNGHRPGGPLSGGGIDALITEYGDELNLTDEQKNDLIVLSLEKREAFRHRRMSHFRQRADHNRPARNMERDRNRRNPGDAPRRDRQREESPRPPTRKISDILNEEQITVLQSIQSEKIEKKYELRVRKNSVWITQAGIENDKAAKVLDILNRLAEDRKTVQLRRVEATGEWDREEAVEHLSGFRESREELKQILTAAEYEKLRKVLGPGRG